MIFKKDMDLKTSVVDWLEYNANEAYEHMKATKKKRGESIPNKDKNDASRMKKLLATIHFMTEETDKKKLVVFDHTMHELREWRESVKSITSSAIDKIASDFISKQYMKPQSQSRKRKRNESTGDEDTNKPAPKLTLSGWHSKASQYQRDIGMNDK